MYTVEALTLGEEITSPLPQDFLSRFTYYRQLNLILTWITIVSIKFSFLFLFKKLIDRIPPLIVYWWFIAAFNGAIAIYGATVPILVCPTLNRTESGESTRGGQGLRAGSDRV